MNNVIKIGKHLVGHGQPTFIVAEIGSNHNQNLDQAKQLIEIAAKAGADAVKFQLYVADDLYSEDSPVYEAVKATELQHGWLHKLSRHAVENSLLFFASPFSTKAVDLLQEVDVPVYKIASSETVKLDLLKHVASKKRPIILSTGMCDLADIYEALKVIRSENNHDVILLQCTSLYPTPMNRVHLRAMDTLRSTFNLPVGFSDHTIDIIIPVAAVARGACLIEKHLTLDRHLPGPDHSYALEPQEFTQMVGAIRGTEEALGSIDKIMLPEEGQYARRESVRAAQDIPSGETILPSMLHFGRPGDGIRPRYVSAVVGQKILRPVKRGEPITWELIKLRKGE
jgi:N,N'-diacetyllegionaminate synthase